jgi:hypothetical protein
VATEFDARYTRYEVKVSRKGRTLARLTPLVRSRGFVQSILWKVPSGTKPGTLRFTVEGIGPAPVVRSLEAEAALQVRAIRNQSPSFDKRQEGGSGESTLAQGSVEGAA